MRGEGFTFEIYRFNDEISKYFRSPDSAFFKDFPSADFRVSPWRETPLPDTLFLNSMMPVYGNWPDRRQEKMESRYAIVKQIAKSKGSYYAIREASGNDLYLLSPNRRLLIWINCNF